MRNKGKVHPLTSSSSASASSQNQNKDALSVLKLLPVAIFALVSVLSLQDREVLAYMIARSLKSSNPSIFQAENKREISKKHSFDWQGHTEPALFDCDCFFCYTSFWLKWDSSPNHELIHEAIEAFEDHLNSGELLKKSPNAKNKKKEKMGRRRNERAAGSEGAGGSESPLVENQAVIVSVLPESEVVPVAEEQKLGENGVEAPRRSVAVESHKGLARKFLPDVMGIFISRLWSFWGPNV